MNSKHVTVGYKWTAQPGKLDELASIYADVTTAMEQNEPGAEAVHVYVSEEENALYVRDEFTDADAVGFHLGTTAGAHFPSLLAIATPGPVLLHGADPRRDEGGHRANGAWGRVQLAHSRLRS